jgi:uncharacterized protein (DUF488 family)
LYLGKELGGMPKDSDFYDGDGNVMHNKIAETGLFKFGIERLQKGVSLYTVALCCGEENPTGCHRRLLIGRVMSQLGVEVLHIRGDGSLQTEADLEAASGENVKQLRFLD